MLFEHRNQCLNLWVSCGEGHESEMMIQLEDDQLLTVPAVPNLDRIIAGSEMTITYDEVVKRKMVTKRGSRWRRILGS